MDLTDGHDPAAVARGGQAAVAMQLAGGRLVAQWASGRRVGGVGVGVGVGVGDGVGVGVGVGAPSHIHTRWSVWST